MSKFGSLAPSDKPHRVLIKLDGKQIVDKNGKPFFIDVYSEDSASRPPLRQGAARAGARQCPERRKDQPTQLEINIAKCAALTAAWHLVDPETLEPIDEPCTAENAKEFYSLPLTTWIWLQPWAAANNHVNFIKRSAKSSSPTQSGPSETVAARRRGDRRRSPQIGCGAVRKLGIKPKQPIEIPASRISRKLSACLALVP
jgi:hypothetical protein